MHLRTLIVSAAAVFIPCASVMASASVPDIQHDAKQSDEQKLFEGDWDTVVGASHLLFRFKSENGVLVGWFVSAKNGQSYPFKEVHAKGRTLTFIYTSKPEFTYTLKAQKGNQVLSGISSTPDGEATPRTLVRKASQ